MVDTMETKLNIEKHLKNMCMVGGVYINLCKVLYFNII